MQMMTGTQVTGSVNPPRLPAQEEKLRRAMTKETSGEGLGLAKLFRHSGRRKRGRRQEQHFDVLQNWQKNRRCCILLAAEYTSVDFLRMKHLNQLIDHVPTVSLSGADGEQYFCSALDNAAMRGRWTLWSSSIM